MPLNLEIKSIIKTSGGDIIHESEEGTYHQVGTRFEIEYNYGGERKVFSRDYTDECNAEILLGGDSSNNVIQILGQDGGVPFSIEFGLNAADPYLYGLLEQIREERRGDQSGAVLVEATNRGGILKNRRKKSKRKKKKNIKRTKKSKRSKRTKKSKRKKYRKRKRLIHTKKK